MVATEMEKVIKKLYVAIKEVMSFWYITCEGMRENKEGWKTPEYLI